MTKVNHHNGLQEIRRLHAEARGFVSGYKRGSEKHLAWFDEIPAILDALEAAVPDDLEDAMSHVIVCTSAFSDCLRRAKSRTKAAKALAEFIGGKDE